MAEMSETARRYLEQTSASHESAVIVVEPSLPSTEPDPMLVLLERIAAALEKIAERRT